MNNGELIDRILKESHRSDLRPVAQDFINRASERLNNRFGLNLGDMFELTDSNFVSANHDVLYHYAAMRELYLHVKDFDQAVRWDELFDKECGRMNIHNRQASWPYTGVTPITKSEEQQIAEASINAN